VILKKVDMIIRIDWTHLSIFRLPVSKAYAQEGGLNLDNIGVGDGPFSDGNGQHIHYISERAQGRH
jgi:hypothetical protein